jgi:hypothetical protein
MTNAVSLAQQASTGVSPGFRNRIINGSMTIDQRNAGASVTPADGAYTLDRWKYEASQASKFTVQQNAGSVTPPVGFSNYLGMTVASAVSIGSSDFFIIEQFIEGFNFADLGWGTANAKPITLSFQVYSSLTGTFGVGFRNSAVNRNYQASYTISSANTWTTVSITIAGDTSGTWVGATNGVALRVNWGLGVGSTFSTSAGAWGSGNIFGLTGATSVVGTSGATFYITGVQLEVGSTATSFDFRSIGTELALCQRYFYNLTGNNSNTMSIMTGQAYATSAVIGCFIPIVEMRGTPTLSYSGLNTWTSGGNNSGATTWTIDTGSSGKLLRINASGSTTLVAGNASGMILNNSASYFNLSAEL